MQHKLVAFSAVAIKSVTDNGAAKAQIMGGVDPQLVGPAGEGGKFYSGVLAFDAKVSPVTGPNLAMHRVIDLVRAVVGIESEWKLNLAGFFFYMALQQSYISFVYQTFSKLLGKVPV